MTRTNYTALPDTWFDAGTHVLLLDDYRPTWNTGLFRGLHNGKPDEEICLFEELEVTEVDNEN